MSWLRCEDVGFAVPGVVDAFAFAAEVVAPVGVEVAAGGEGAELEDGLGAFESPSRACYVHSVLDDVAACPLDDPGGDRPASGEGGGVVQAVLLVVQVAGAFVGAGETGSSVERAAFIEDARATLEQLVADMDTAKSELDLLTSGAMNAVSLADESLFENRSGTRITTKQIRDHPPDPDDPSDNIKVYSCFKDAVIIKGEVSKKWLDMQKRHRRGQDRTGTPSEPAFPIETAPSVTVNANGASVGKVFVRPTGCLLTDDVIAVQPTNSTAIDLDYLSVALQSAVTAGGFLYEAKLFTTRLKELSVSIPVDDNGEFDLEQERRIASAAKRFDAIVSRLAELGRWSSEARIVF